MLLMLNAVKGPARIHSTDKEKVIISDRLNDPKQTHSLQQLLEDLNNILFQSSKESKYKEKPPSKGMQKRDSHVYPAYKL